MTVSNRSERRSAQRSTAVLTYVLVIVSLQIFLLVVAVEGLLSHERSLAIAAAVMSLVLFGGALLFRQLLDRDRAGS